MRSNCAIIKAPITAPRNIRDVHYLRPTNNELIILPDSVVDNGQERVLDCNDTGSETMEKMNEHSIICLSMSSRIPSVASLIKVTRHSVDGNESNCRKRDSN